MMLRSQRKSRAGVKRDSESRQSKVEDGGTPNSLSRIELKGPKDFASIPKPASASEDEESDATEPTHEAIAARAYAIWLERGGNDVVNWLQAENELRGEFFRQYDRETSLSR